MKQGDKNGLVLVFCNFLSVFLDAQYLQIILELSEARQGAPAIVATVRSARFGPTEKRSQPWRIYIALGVGEMKKVLGGM